MQPTIRVLESGELSIGPAVCRAFLAGVRHVELLFDPDRERIGLRPRTRPTRASYKLRPQGGRRRYVHAGQFLEHYEIEDARGRRLPARWNDRAGVVEVALNGRTI